jgi:histone-lysine N-methyltransferase SETD1
MPIAKKKRSVPKPIAKKVIKKRAPSFSSSSSEEPSDDERPLVEDKKPVQEKAETPVIVEDVVMAEEAGVISKKRGGRPKGSKNKKQKLEPAPLVEISKPDEPPLVEIKLPTKTVKPPKAVASPIDKLIVDGTVVDEEDAYWLGQALAELEPDEEGDLAEVEVVSEDHPLHHQSGSWRAEGFKQIPKTRKSEYLPQQNKGKVEQDNSSLTSGRTARVTGRRLAHDIDATRKATTAQTSETDTFAFNQLRTRKKQLKFSRSPIEGYGLYAMESIAVGEMICEYVGDIIRSSVAEIREQRYLKQGIGSSYLFRIDGDVVCDATFRGSVR